MYARVREAFDAAADAPPGSSAATPAEPVVRDFYTRLLARGRLLGVFALAPAVVLGWLVASRLERTVGAVLADPLVQSLAAAAGVLLLVAAGRRRLLARLDAWLHPEMVAGEHPFAGGGVDAVAGRIRRRRLGRDVWPAAASESSSAVVAFTASMLTASRAVRPATARAFSDALSEVLP